MLANSAFEPHPRSLAATWPRETVESWGRPFTDLAEQLSSATAGRRIYFMQNHGNFGDALIRYGTIRFFEDLGVSFQEFDMGRRVDKVRCLAAGARQRLGESALFIYSSSGAWAEACRVGYDNVKRQLRVASNMFVLPTTFQLFDLDAEIDIFVRDRHESQALLPDRPFCHDMAFYLAMIDPDRVLPDRRPPSKSTAFAFRVDNESSGHGWSDIDANHDVSNAGDHRSDPQDFLRYLDDFEEIITDRLHVAIGGAVLGKPVFVAPGNYFKIRAIFESSIRSVFDNVTLVETADALSTLVRERAASAA